MSEVTVRADTGPLKPQSFRVVVKLWPTLTSQRTRGEDGAPSGPLSKGSYREDFSRKLLELRSGFCLVLFVGVDHSQQRRGDQDTPERNEDAQNDRSEDGRPDRHAGGALHDVGLKKKAVDDDDARVQHQHVKRMLQASPVDPGGQHGPEQAQYRTDVGHNLKNRSQDCPQRRPRNLQQVKTKQPETADCQRILRLGESPVFQGAAGDTSVLAKTHSDLDAVSRTNFGEFPTRVNLAGRFFVHSDIGPVASRQSSARSLDRKLLPG